MTVYDVTKRDTFTKLGNWLNELETYTTRHDIVKMLVGNKIDMVSRQSEPPVILLCLEGQFKSFFFLHIFLQEDREVDRNEGLKFARKHSMLFIGK